MNRKFLARLSSGLLALGMAGTVNATQYFAPEVYDYIGPDQKTYEFNFRGLSSPARYLGSYLFIQEKGGDFNNEWDRISVKINGVYFGGFTFATDNSSNDTTRLLPVPLSYTDLFYITNSGAAVVEITVSDDITDTSYEQSLEVWLDYQDHVGRAFDVVAFFEDAVASGTIVGVGNGNSGKNRLKKFGNMLHSTVDLIKAGDTEGACELLMDTMERADGETPPADYVTGEDVPKLYGMLLLGRFAIGC